MMCVFSVEDERLPGRGLSSGSDNDDRRTVSFPALVLYTAVTVRDRSPQ